MITTRLTLNNAKKSFSDKKKNLLYKMHANRPILVKIAYFKKFIFLTGEMQTNNLK